MIERLREREKNKIKMGARDSQVEKTRDRKTERKSLGKRFRERIIERERKRNRLTEMEKENEMQGVMGGHCVFMCENNGSHVCTLALKILACYPHLRNNNRQFCLIGHHDSKPSCCSFFFSRPDLSNVFFINSICFLFVL